MDARLSSHFLGRRPSAIRQAQIRYLRRADRERVRVINVAIGDVTRPMHPAMRARMGALGEEGSPFAGGVVGYGPTVGLDETRAAFLNVIAASGCRSEGLFALVTDGASQAMELMLVGVCGPGTDEPVLLLDPSYTNYRDLAKRLAVKAVSARRTLAAGRPFAAPDVETLEAVVRAERPRALVVLPADNPTGQLVSQETLRDYARVCVDHGMWLVGDEAYRELHFTGGPAPSIWRLEERDVPGIVGRRIGIESASKVFNACGLRIGALVTDHEEFHARAVAEATATLCANVIGQYVYGALAHQSPEELGAWFEAQRRVYAGVARRIVAGIEEALPRAVVTRPEASLYAVVDVAGHVDASFRAGDFVAYCAEKGKVPVEGVDHTLLVAPMDGFYPAGDDAGRTQMRLALVASERELEKVPRLLAELLRQYGEARPAEGG